ncbi:hypothetical protein IFM89_012839 [Coptis chinensis]|uniref:RBR-type E3 ubiquitin transferase n=1 Tax=Coptis chinensis TaxID=261450 RepID=A0A835IYN3_9MAGN|nr:hypothetical protein IFM89_012839 [Coptis chinensis]
MSGWFSVIGQVLALSSVVTMVFLGYKCEAKCEFKAISNFGDSNSDNCRICFDDFLRRDMVSVACGHLFCKLCWKGYITISINDGPGCLTMRCPEIKCVAAVDDELVNQLVSNEEQWKYLRFLLRSYVEVKKRIKWCPSPDCDNAVEFVGGSYDVSCNCKHNFC